MLVERVHRLSLHKKGQNACVGMRGVHTSQEEVGPASLSVRGGVEGRSQTEVQGKAYRAVAGKPMGEKTRGQPSARAQRPADGHEESPEASKSHANWNRAWERPFCVPRPASPTPGAQKQRGHSLSDVMPPSPAGSARWWGHQGVSIYYPPPTLRSSGAGCWGGGCSMLRCHGNRPNPHLPKHKERQLSPPPPGRTWVWLGIFPWESSFLMHKPRHA